VNSCTLSRCLASGNRSQIETA